MDAQISSLLLSDAGESGGGGESGLRQRTRNVSVNISLESRRTQIQNIGCDTTLDDRRAVAAARLRAMLNIMTEGDLSVN